MMMAIIVRKRRRRRRQKNAKLVTHGYNKTEAPEDETKKTNLFEVESWKKELEEKTERRLFEKRGQASEKTGGR